MKTQLIRIGNSRGVRIPKPMIEQLGLGRNVELWAENDCLVIAPERRPRQGWAERFAVAEASHDHELLLDDSSPSAFDLKEWNW